MKLKPEQLHIMRLAQRDKKPDGWATVSEMVFPLLANIPEALMERKETPEALMERKETPEGRFCKLTPEGETILAWS